MNIYVFNISLILKNELSNIRKSFNRNKNFDEKNKYTSYFIWSQMDKSQLLSFIFKLRMIKIKNGLF